MQRQARQAQEKKLIIQRYRQTEDIQMDSIKRRKKGAGERGRGKGEKPPVGGI